jgi:NhaA family Na+:H+ antiporter
MLAGAAVTVALLFIMNRADYPAVSLSAGGGVLWFFMLQSGVHATIAGILLALFIPLRVTDPDKQSPLARLSTASIRGDVSDTAVWLRKCGGRASGMTADDLMSPVPVGVAGPVCWQAGGHFRPVAAGRQPGLAKRPEKSTWLQVYGVSVLCGIGLP